ncbi:hypothetical protein ACSBR2_014925 [Camellia fascicularis]
MIKPKWLDNRYPPIDFQDLCYHSEPKKKPILNSLDEADPELIGNLMNFKFQKELEKVGVIFCSISEAIREYPDLVIETGQFKRTLTVADDRSFAEYLEGCTAPSYDRNQLHAAVVELSKISWMQLETGSAITWKYPSVVLEGDDSVGEFYSVALTKNHQQADTGTNMIHKGKNTRSRIVSKGILAGNSRNCYRGLVQVQSRADDAQNFLQCDSMLIGDNAAANTYPYIQVKNSRANIEHEASISKIGDDQLFYFEQRGIES